MDDDEFLRAAAESYKSRRLRYLVGAGVSQAAGLPSWTDLNLRLLSRFLNHLNQRLALQPSDLREISTVFMERFGRDAAVDIVREQWPDKGKSFSDLLRDALYSGRRWEPQAIHFELAAALSPARCWTFNYDDLLESAIARRLGRKAHVRVETKEPPDAQPDVVHLHGYLPLDSDTEYEHEPSLVLSEQDYHRTAGGWPTAQLQELLTTRDDVDIILVGLSLADTQLRSVLLERREILERGAKKLGRVFALLTPSQCSADSPLITRMAHSLTRLHEQESWAFWNIKVLYPKHHELVPFYLRQIRLGTDPSAWFEKAEGHLQKTSEIYRTLFTRDVQLDLVRQLQALLEFLCTRFAADRDEYVSIGAYVPWEKRLLQAFRAKAGTTEDENVLSDTPAERLELRVDDLKNPEGLTGHSFVTGAVAQSGSDRLYEHFADQAKRRAWEEKRDFSSLLSVPIYGSPSWVPLGVMYLTSNRPAPFWSKLPLEEQYQLHIALRTCFYELLRYDS